MHSLTLHCFWVYIWIHKQFPFWVDYCISKWNFSIAQFSSSVTNEHKEHSNSYCIKVSCSYPEIPRDISGSFRVKYTHYGTMFVFYLLKQTSGSTIASSYIKFCTHLKIQLHMYLKIVIVIHLYMHDLLILTCVQYSESSQ